MKLLSYAFGTVVCVSLLVEAAHTASTHVKLQELHERKKELDTQLTDLVHERNTLKKKFDAYDAQRKQLDVDKEGLLKQLGCHTAEHGAKNETLHARMASLIKKQEELHAEWDAYDKEREALHTSHMNHYYTMCRQIEDDRQ